MEENYRDDLAFKTVGIKKLQRKTLNLADVFNIIFEQLISNDAVLKTEINTLQQHNEFLSLLAENFTIQNGKLYQILRR